VSPGRPATELGVSLATVYNWESGKFDPRASQLRALARLFGVSMDAIDFDAKEAGKRDSGRIE